MREHKISPEESFAPAPRTSHSAAFGSLKLRWMEDMLEDDSDCEDYRSTQDSAIWMSDEEYAIGAQRLDTPWLLGYQQVVNKLPTSCQQAVKRKNVFSPNTFSRVNKPKD